MNDDTNKLFSPISIGSVKVKNRFFMSPMGNFGYTDEFGAITDDGIDYFVERAKGGVGLIFTGFCVVDENIEKVETPSILVIKDNPIEFIKKASVLTEKVHAYDTKIFLQLTAGFGRGANIVKVNKRIAVSDIPNKHNPAKLHKAMTLEDIHNIIEAYGRASLIAKQCGFDGVEVHAVHEGYLLDQFTVDCTNKRNDEYGGCKENKYRIAKDIVAEIKDKCGSLFPVSIRYSVKHYMKSLTEGILPEEEKTVDEFGRDFDEGIELAKYLEKVGYDALNVDIGSYEAHYLCHPNIFTKDGLYLDAASMVTKKVKIPVLVAGKMDKIELAIEAIETHKCDMIGFGRPLLADSHIVNKIRLDDFDSIRHCISCNYGCITNRMKHKAVKCAINPLCYQERKNQLNRLAVKKRIAVIGGGPAGMQSALTLAQRGHDVTLYEKSYRLGGNLNYAGAILYKYNIINLISWFRYELTRNGVKIKLNTKVDADFIRRLDVDTVIVATGAIPRKLNLDGFDNPDVMYAHKSYFTDKLGQNIVIIGAGAIGMETAIWLSKQGKSVKVIEATNDIMGGKGNVAGGDYSMVWNYIKYYNIEMFFYHTVMSYKSNKLTVKDKSSDEINYIKVDNVIVSVGYESSDKLYNDIMNLSNIKEIYNIGDSRKVANIYYAIHDAYEISNNI